MFFNKEKSIPENMQDDSVELETIIFFCVKQDGTGQANGKIASYGSMGGQGPDGTDPSATSYMGQEQAGDFQPTYTTQHIHVSFLLSFIKYISCCIFL